MRSLIVAILYFAVALPSNATLIGDQVTTRLTSFGKVWLDNATGTIVDPGVEFQVQTNQGDVIKHDITVDFNGSQITLTIKDAGGNSPIRVLYDLHSFEFSDLQWVGMPNGVITDVVLVEGTSTFEYDPWVLNVGDHGFDIAVRASNSYPANGIMTATWDIKTRHKEIPEPTTMALLGMGAAGLIAKRRRSGARADL